MTMILIMKLAQSAYSTNFVFFAVTVGKSFIYNKKSKGPRIVNMVLVHSAVLHVKEPLRKLSSITVRALRYIRQSCSRPKKFEACLLKGR
jgi:hypothetical protein